MAIPKRAASRVTPARGHPVRPGAGGRGGTQLGRGTRTAKKSNAPLMIGGGVGALALVIVLVAVFGSGKTPEAPARKPEAAKPVVNRPPNVEELVDEGMRKAEEGYKLIQSCKPQVDGSSELTEAQKKDLKKKLEEGVKLIEQGSNKLDQASQMTSKTEGDFKNEWGQARKWAVNFIANLGK
jgi:hypothetical protein